MKGNQMRKKITVESCVPILIDPPFHDYQTKGVLDKLIPNLLREARGSKSMLAEKLPTVTGRMYVAEPNSYLLDDFQGLTRHRSGKVPEIRFISLEMDFAEIEKRIQASFKARGGL
jgi:hypothetical protein